MKRLIPSLVLAAAALLAVGVSPASAGPSVRVPDVTGLDLEDALGRLEGARLEANVTWLPGGERGRVSGQNPAARTRVAVGAVVELQVEGGIQVQTIVPDVVGMDVEEVVSALEEVYELEIEEVSVSRRAGGRIVGTTPRAGNQLPFRGTLRLLVGRSQRRGLQPSVDVPKVTGQMLAVAEDALLGRGLIPVPTFVARGMPGQVTRQDPSPGTMVPLGAHVGLNVAVALGSRRGVRVPSLWGLSPTEALSALGALSLSARVERVPSHFEEDTVIRQLPEVGSRVTPRTTVSLVVAYPVQGRRVLSRTAVPKLLGLPLPEAFARIREAGLRVEIERRAGALGVPEEQVSAQHPEAGGRVPLGSVVRIAVLHFTITAVPDLAGLTADEAARLVEEAGLTISFDGDSRHGLARRVVSQSPLAGTRAFPGAVVRVVLRADPNRFRALVPNLAGRTLEEARTLLATAGLSGQMTGPGLTPGARTVVVGQTPTAGERVPRGSTVQVRYKLRLVVAQVAVPDLRGHPLATAQRMLLQRGLMGVVSVVRGAGPSVVTGQSPAAGTLVPQGTQVRYTIRR